ncbi:hypothetical protein JK636_01215 [Clostridium sp. YIM B02515]|uniref:Uncharacterized protein n=1 Tax=Clostridium rhizosphaerae TaxID=2803861 RepID=A0ABS1T6S6_9CLOT|nr:hypothetical protein [Clostridium rhizosphaerae]
MDGKKQIKTFENNNWVGNGYSDWDGLINPCDSGVNLFTNVLTISNFSDEYLTAEYGLTLSCLKKDVYLKSFFV